jgi:YcxB-like protein
MQVAFLLSPGEFETARKAFSKRMQSRAKRALPWLNVGFALAMAITHLLAGFRFFLHPHRAPDRFALVLVPIWLAIAVVHWATRHRLDPEPDYGKEQVFEFGEEGIFRLAAGNTKLRVPWTKIGRYAETDEFFLLSSPWPWGTGKPEKLSILARQKKPVLYILPKRAFDAGDIGRFRDLLQRKLSVWAKNPGLKADTILTV